MRRRRRAPVRFNPLLTSAGRSLLSSGVSRTGADGDDDELRARQRAAGGDAAPRRILTRRLQVQSERT